ncbi:MAG: ATP-binding protein [Acidimicrobiia bacterium]|nr:ATP-binding protein [Acidimicrobiia bacterium]
MYERLIGPRLKEDRHSALLLGPRQVGKSTLLGSLAPDLTLNLASLATFREYVAQPERLEAELAAAPAHVKTVFIDEVQRVPALLDGIQAIVDAHPRRFRFLLSGSSARKLRRGHANLLPGRIVLQYLHPLMARELQSDFNLDRVLAHGTLPGIYSDRDPESRSLTLRSYVDAYLREEIQAEALVRDIGGYARLLDLAAASSGRVVNLNALSRDAAVSYETARRYLDVLEDTLILFRIPAWRGSDRASLVAHPKLLLFDIGVRNAILRRPLDRPLDDERGLLLEHLVGLELRRREGTIWPEARVQHFRTRRGAELDFVLSVGREHWAIDVKASRQVDSRDLKGFVAFAEHARKVTRRIVVFLGTRRQRVDDIEVWPVEDFLADLPG